MPYSHHSHSGEFCEGHAVDKLEEVVQDAIRRNMEVLCLTEHIPRFRVEDLYPEEVVSAATIAQLMQIFDRFYEEARRLQATYKDKIMLFVGFEIDWMRPSSEQDIKNLLSKHQWDMFVGSVHHVHGVPIDYSPLLYDQAREESAIRALEAHIPADPEEMLFADYFDAQLEMLQALKPPVVGHFDLIRLLSNEPDESMRQWSRVWRKILRNLQFIHEYGGIIEVNSAALRKGLKYPYPSREILERVVEMKGKVTLSDDSHGKTQIGFGYKQTLNYMYSCGVAAVTVLTPSQNAQDTRFPGVGTREISIEELQKHPFWKEC